MLYIKIDGFYNRLAREWKREENLSIHTAARKHAAKHGYAGVWHADGSFALYYLDKVSGAVCVKTWKQAAERR